MTTLRSIEVPETLFFTLWEDYLERVPASDCPELVARVWAVLGSSATVLALPVRLVALGEDRGTVEVSVRGDLDAATWVVPLCDLFDVEWSDDTRWGES